MAREPATKWVTITGLIISIVFKTCETVAELPGLPAGYGPTTFTPAQQKQRQYVDEEITKLIDSGKNLIDFATEPIDKTGPSKEKLSAQEEFLKSSASRSITDCPDPVSDASCDFIDLKDSEDFEEVFVDCMNQPLSTNAGRWFKPKQAFSGKGQSLYHIPPENLGLREVDFSTADNYCRNLDVDNSYLWCPASTEENFYLWWHHNGQPFGGTDGPSVWTGIIRLSSSGLFSNDGFTCHDLYNQTYFNWISGQPSFVHFNTFLPEWNTVLTCNTPNWDDINDSDPAAIVCEMMCDLVEDPSNSCPLDSMSGTQIVNVSADTGLYDLLSQFACSEEVDEIVNHGCHCVGLDQVGITIDYRGGSVKMDFVDENCKYWREARKCLTLPGGSCEGVHVKNTFYTVEVDYDLESFDCTDLADPCFRDICLIDSYFSSEIWVEESIKDESFTAIIGDVEVCPKKEPSGGEGGSGTGPSCVGEAPNVSVLK